MGRNDEIMEWDESRIEPVTLILDVLSNWWVVLLGAIAAALITNVVMNTTYVPRFTSTATFAVTSKEESNAFTNLNVTYEMAQTFQAILESNAMNSIICDELGVPSVAADISSSILGETNLLTLNVTAKTSREAVEIINVIMEHYEEVSYFALGSANMTVLEPPTLPIYPDNPLDVAQSMKKAFLGGILGLLALFALLSYFHDTVKCERDIEKKLDAKSLGKISFERKYKTLKEMFRHKKGALLVNNPLAGFTFVEDYKKLATKVDYQMRKKGKNTIVVTSVSENEGKSTVAANLAISLANQSKKVLLIEGDLRRPAQFLIFNKSPRDKQEIGEYLKGNVELTDILMESGISRLYLMLGKNCYSSSTEIINSDATRDLLESMRSEVDYIIIDTPPAGLTGDAEVFAKYDAAVLLVAKQNYMLAEDINEVLDSFREHRAKVLGVVLNGVKNFGEFSENGHYGDYSNYVRSRGNE